MNAIRNLALLGIMCGACMASAQSDVPNGTEVILRFDQPVSSRSAKAGDEIHLHVARDVVYGDRTILSAGTPVKGIIERVDKNDHFGKNARIRLALSAVNGIPLQPRDKGKPFQGASTDHAAIASGAGALVFGPLGLVGGYFFTGKSVNIHTGDTLRTEVARP
jgi:hypothetical protein